MTQPLEQPTDLVTLKRQRRRGCIFRLLAIWFLLLGLIVIAMIFVRSRVNRIPDEVAAEAAKLIDFELPEGFYPYSHSRFFGAELLVFWHRDHVREDGRTTSLLAIYVEDDWRDKPLQEVETKILAELQDRLGDNEFHTEEYTQHPIGGEANQGSVHSFDGVTRLEADLIKAATCYRFLVSPRGPIQVHTMGLTEEFSLEQQIGWLKTVRGSQIMP